jgi:uncharacterized membrane protein
MTTDRAERTFSSDFKRFFLRGLVILLPSVLTLWIVVKAYQFVDNTIAEPINGWVRVGVIQLSNAWSPVRNAFDPDAEELQSEILARQAMGARNIQPEVLRAELRAATIRREWAEHWYLDFIGLIIAVVAVYVAGRLLGGFVGRQVYRKLERLITRVPVFKQVYPYVKQFVDFLFSDDRPVKFSRVVIVEYPRKGIWSLGFVTGSAMKSVASEVGDSVTIFIPSSPTPFTGWAITVARKEAIEVPITVEEAIRFLVTGGVLIPEHQRMASGQPGAADPASGTPHRHLPAAAASRVPRDSGGGR